MKVHFAPTNYPRSGVVSRISWYDPDLQNAIRQVFYESPRENITEIIIDLNGITAVFEAKSMENVALKTAAERLRQGVLL